MKIIVFVFVLMTLTTNANSQFLVTRLQNSNVTITVSPTYIVEGLKSQVDIVCSFKRINVPSIASVLTMILGHSNKTDKPEFNFLATVNGMEGHAHNVSHDIDVISGSIDNNGESTLHMRFTYPTTHLIGLYMCEVTGFDQIGKPVTFYSTINVVTTNITDLLDALHIAQSNITSLADELQRFQANLSTCQTANSNYYPPLTYNRHVYYLSHELNYFNYTAMESKCEILGGYLIELDSHDEFSFIRGELTKLLGVGAVWTGTTDEENEGVWINKHNSTARPSFDWGPHEPVGGRSNNCQCFFYPLRWYLAECYCYHTGPYNYYICEIPQ